MEKFIKSWKCCKFIYHLFVYLNIFIVFVLYKGPIAKWTQSERCHLTDPLTHPSTASSTIFQCNLRFSVKGWHNFLAIFSWEVCSIHMIRSWCIRYSNGNNLTRVYFVCLDSNSQILLYMWYFDIRPENNGINRTIWKTSAKQPPPPPPPSQQWRLFSLIFSIFIVQLSLCLVTTS